MGFVTNDPNSRWENGIVPFVINASILMPDQTTLLKAITLWNEVAPIKLVQRQGQSNYLEFINGQANYGGRAVGGPNSGRATISMDFRWGDNGNENIVIRALMHEIGHIVSLIHEHQRPDRDQYINILNDPNNGDTAVRYDGLLVEPYDCVSIMHYVPVGAATDPMPKPGGCQNFGRLNDPSLSSGDLAALKFLYPDKWDNWHQLGVEQIAQARLYVRGHQVALMRLHVAPTTLCIPSHGMGGSGITGTNSVSSRYRPILPRFLGAPIESMCLHVAPITLCMPSHGMAENAVKTNRKNKFSTVENRRSPVLYCTVR